MLTNELIRSKFDAGLDYAAYLATAKPHERDNWHNFHARARLTHEQQRLIGGFVRAMNVVVVSGAWCGDCVQQCPMLDHIARARPDLVRVRFVDRDLHADLSDLVRICSGQRVPVAVFANEDFDFVSLFGDRTLSRYRALAARQLGPSCPLPGAPVPDDEIAATLADWVNEFERVHLLLRLSGKLRQRHAD